MISVIVPMYNASKCISKCLSSLIGQTIFNELEVILVNDGSTDSTKEVVQKQICNYKNIKIIDIENAGVSNARNIGIKNSTGEYISFVDSDDYLDKDFYEVLLKEITHGFDIVCCGFYAEYDNGKIITSVSKSKEKLTSDRAMYCFLLGQSLNPHVTNKLFRKELLTDTWFDTNYKIAEDKYFIFQLLKKKCKVLVLPEAKYHYYICDSSVTRDVFSVWKFHSLEVASNILNEVIEVFPQFYEVAYSAKIDVECRICGEICYFDVVQEYKQIYKTLRNDIRRYSAIRKAKYSNKKHLVAFIIAKINPALYAFIKKKLKFEFK